MLGKGRADIEAATQWMILSVWIEALGVYEKLSPGTGEAVRASSS